MRVSFVWDRVSVSLCARLICAQGSYVLSQQWQVVFLAVSFCWGCVMVDIIEQTLVAELWQCQQVRSSLPTSQISCWSSLSSFNHFKVFHYCCCCIIGWCCAHMQICILFYLFFFESFVPAFWDSYGFLNAFLRYMEIYKRILQ